MSKILKRYSFFLLLLFISFILSIYSAKLIYDIKRSSYEKIEKRLEKALESTDKEVLNQSIETQSSTSYQNKDLYLLARVINGEARGEPYIGQVAIGAVIINRTKHPGFPKTISGVIYQPGAFTCVSDGQINAKLEPTALKAARDALNGWDPTNGCIYYYNPAKTTNKWIWSRKVMLVIGKHRFAK
ncbi:N-acetylmuramoyl-L-alanine amidase [Caldicellulosiruptor bescii]|uniref:Cell wall hydrolase SleB n=3 Tax=Caldicellulosiruptor TaxID=44000 RepID=B9MKM8_CALBD|nr:MULTISPECIES: cell wall hydrolase [Caldicellulosiruptor]ACM60886.1 cell wall hydrolase SleB [Caldicellulosiruptor bescii DSM 6725]ADQ45792.1 cell wall hydrolase SleB [Caldicellulosiruptor kronotskyensis 2002]PBC89296.1 N-acetylmuramoyl-L-alanine amidase [Caldicellulosiruptor bescii]PBC91219.1 N-acetylmuramoyl-L-alanine amidase [Caldicellulosiruptor bescii]PBD03367.1 N-acetylmuramoyl-L-alanine amidase [Caldicellulosiruptor bescii]